jgi:hypothetical protein
MRRALGAVRSSSLAALAASCGFRRVDLVHIVARPTGSTAEVTGVLHRYPRTVRTSMATAARLVAAGAPLRLDDARATGWGPAC